MDTATIIEHLDAEISRLQQVRALLTDGDVRKGPGRPKASDAISKPVAVKLTKRVMSAEGKKKIALAQKARWAKVRKADKKAATTEKKTVEKAVTPAKAVKSVNTLKAVKPTTPVKAIKPATPVKTVKATAPRKESKKAPAVKS